MKLLYKLLLFTLVINLISCAKNTDEISKIKEINQEAELIYTYKEGVKELKEKNYFNAATKFLESELLFPQSIWAPRSALMASYSYYMMDDYSSARLNLERYIKTYPKHKDMAYAQYLLGMCYYETIIDEATDQEPLINSKKQFQIVVKKYPDTDFAIDANFKLDLINDILAAKEMYIARHYMKNEKWVAAINRFKNILKLYETTIYTEEALHRLVEIHYYIGLKKESKKYANLLGYNYLSSQWYKKSYGLFNKGYKYENKILKKNKKNKKKMTNIFKRLFD